MKYLHNLEIFNQNCTFFRKKDHSINGATYGVAGGSWHGQCFCEKGMNGTDGVSDWISKKLPTGK